MASRIATLAGLECVQTVHLQAAPMFIAGSALLAQACGLAASKGLPFWRNSLGLLLSTCTQELGHRAATLAQMSPAVRRLEAVSLGTVEAMRLLVTFGKAAVQCGMAAAGSRLPTARQVFELA